MFLEIEGIVLGETGVCLNGGEARGLVDAGLGQVGIEAAGRTRAGLYVYLLRYPNASRFTTHAIYRGLFTEAGIYPWATSHSVAQRYLHMEIGAKKERPFVGVKVKGMSVCN